MRTNLAWTDKPVEREGANNIVYDVAFRPDGLQLVAAVGMRVIVYDAVDGTLLHSLKGHKEAVYCVSFSQDGKRFASGGADKQVIIWTANAEGILKYAHTEAIQTLSYNPMTHQLASATALDFGLWSAEAKSVPKHKLPSRALCSSWTNDGQHLALGLFSGLVTIRDRHRPEVEKIRIERSSPIWTLAWNPSRSEQGDTLAVGCWDQTLSFHALSGRPIGKDRDLGSDPCCVSYFANGEYMCVGGSGRSAQLWTKDGIKLSTICERDSWIWTCKARPKANFVLIGCQDGTLAMYQLQFNTVHGLYQERYAYRDNMTDVLVQHLLTDERVRIKCRDHVKKLAVYKDRLAVQLPDRILIYELAHGDDATDMSYRPCERISRTIECSLLVVLSSHVALCQQRVLQLLSYKGTLVREWQLESTVMYIKLVGGEREREGLLVGLENGAVLKVFVDNPFPIPLVKIESAVRCLDLSPSRKKLAVVDEDGTVRVFNLETGEVELSETGASSVAWNSELDDLLCFSGNGTLSIKTGPFPLHTQKLQGFCVGFKGTKIFCLHYVEMKTVDVPQSASLYQYIEKRDFAAAARIACLGVTDQDWINLGLEALRALELKVAREAFVRVKDLRSLNLVRLIEGARRAPGHDDSVLIADVLAHQGKFQEAARLYAKVGRADRAVQMFSDLRQWEEAKQFSGTAGLSNQGELAKKQAEWAEEVNDWRAAADTYIAAGDFARAIRVIGDKGGANDEKLAELVRTLPASARDELQAAAAYLRKGGNLTVAREAYAKIGDIASLVALAVEEGSWEQAVSLARTHPAHTAAVYLPYADWLAVQDRFVEAQDAYKRANRPDKAVRMLEALARNATAEQRFGDTSYYLNLLSLERYKASAAAASAATSSVAGRPRGRSTSLVESAANAPPADLEATLATLAASSGGVPRSPDSLSDEAVELAGQAELYHAYAVVHRFSSSPFTTELPETVFQACRFLIARTGKDSPAGISRMTVLAALAKQARVLGAFKLCRYAHEKLNAYRVPPAWREQLDLQAVSVRAKPFADSDDLLTLCYRCQTSNPLLNAAGDDCVACRHPFVRSFATFEVLPLVRFSPPAHMSFEEVSRLVAREPPPVTVVRAKASAANPWREDYGANAQVLSLGGGGDGEDEMASEDPFTQALMDFENGGSFAPVEVDEAMLLSFRREEVFVQKWPSGALPPTWWKNRVPEITISQCVSCNHFFHGEEWEFAVLSTQQCPFCRAPQEGE